MANYQALDAQGDTIDIAADGAGSGGDPHVPHRRVAAISAGASVDIGATSDAESSSGNGSLIALLKRLRTLFNGGLPAALGQGTMAQGLKVALASDQAAIPVTTTGPQKFSATPTISTSAYASGDTVGGLMTFSSVPAAGTIVQVTVQDKDAEQAALELWLFDASITPAADNAAHSISDADMANCIGVIPVGPYYASALNAVSVAPMPGIAYDLDSGTSIFGILVARSTPTYTSTSDLTVELVIQA